MQVKQILSADRHRKANVALVLCLAAAMVVILVSIIVSGKGVRGHEQGVQGNKKMHLSVADPRPVAKAVETLEAKYGWVITYEDPRYVHSSEIADVTGSVRKDLDKFRPGKSPRVLIPKGGSLTIDYDVEADTNRPTDPATVVRQLLNAHAASSNAVVFQLESGGRAIHVMPTAFRNRAGELVPQESVLNSSITLPAGRRSGLQSLEALCTAVSEATQMRVVVGTIPLKLFMQPRNQQGAAGERARDVLVNMLEDIKSGTKLSWQLLYDPGMQMYVLNIHEVPTPNG